MALAHLALTLAILAPQDKQDPDPRFSSILTKIEQGKLNKLAQTWFAAWQKYDAIEQTNKRAKARKVRDAARKKFMKEWEAKQKQKKDPLKHMGDLLAIFDNVFPYKKQSASGEIKVIKNKGGRDYGVLLPAGYKHTNRYPCVLMLPDRGEGKFAEEKQHFGQTWKPAEKAKEFLFIVPKLNDASGSTEFDLDAVPDQSTQAGAQQEYANIEAVLGVAGQAQLQFRMDRNRLILDCGKGSGHFGLRLATYFPTRFAGVILRHPVDPGDLRLGSLAGKPVMLIETADTKAACDEIKKRLDEVQAGFCTIEKGEDEALPNKVAEWSAKAERDWFRTKVVVAPNHDRFQKAYWVSIGIAESLYSGLERDKLPHVEAEVDRAANRITIKARSVSAIALLLNDALLDLDKEFTIVVNGKAITEKRERSLYNMTEWLFTYWDPNYLWTTSYKTVVPKAEDGSNGGGNGEK